MSSVFALFALCLFVVELVHIDAHCTERTCGGAIYLVAVVPLSCAHWGTPESGLHCSCGGWLGVRLAGSVQSH